MNDSVNIDFRLLGPVEVWSGDQQVALCGRQQRTLLAALLLQANRVVAAERLIAVLWGTDAPRTARHSLQVRASQLRRLLARADGDTGSHGADRLVFRPPGYRLRVASGELDWQRFEQLAESGRQRLSTGDARGAVESLREALGLWRGLAMDDVPSEALGDQRLWMDNRRLAAREDWIEAELRLGGHERVVGELQELVGEHPLRERLRGQLMLALYRGGRQAEALEVFRQTRHLLVEEVGLEPGTELRRLQRAILTSDPDLDAPAEPAPKRDTGTTAAPSPVPSPAPLLAEPTAATPRHLPPDITDFSGRHAQLETLSGLLAGAADSSITTMIAITGCAGVGKTTLAVHAAHRFRDGFPDGQLYIDLNGAEVVPADPGEVLARFLVALGLDGRALPGELDERTALFRTVTADREILVILDNAADERQVRPLLPGGRRCAVIMTSRWRLAGLSVHRLQLEMLEAQSAEALLARVIGPERVAAEPDAAAEILDLCGNLPLAVRIAGARLTTRPDWSLRHLADRLRHERRRLDEFTVGDLSVRAGLALSYRGLAPAARRAFRLLALLDAPDFAAWTLAAVLDAPMEEAEPLIDKLVDAQLLSCSGTGEDGQSRYRFHDLVRLYARERADEEETAEQRCEAVTRVLGAWLALAEAADRRLPELVAAPIRGRAPRWRYEPAHVSSLAADPVAWFDSERPALAAGVSQACRTGLDELAWELCAGTVGYYAFRGLYTDWADTHQQAMELCGRAGNRLGEAVMTRNLAHLRITGMRATPGVIMDKAETALATFQESGERHGTVDLLVLWAFALHNRGESDRALAQVERAMAIAHDIGYELGQCRLWCLRAVAYRERGHYLQAADCARHCLDLATWVGTLHDRTLALWEVAGACHDDSALPHVVRDLQEGMEICRQRQEQLLHAYLLLALADLELRFRRQDPQRLIEQALAVFDDYAVPYGQAVGLRLLGRTHHLNQRPRQAILPLNQAVQRTRRLRNVHEQALTLAALGHAHHALGDRDAARAAWQSAQRLFERIRNKAEAAEMTRLLTEHPEP